MTDFPKKGRRGHPQLPPHGLRQQLHLIVAPAQLPQTADGNPRQHVEAVGVLILDTHGQQPTVGNCVISRAAELITQKTPSYVPFIVPDRGETVKKLTPSFSIKIFGSLLPAGAAQVKLLFPQDFAAQNALGRKQHAQQPMNQSHSVFPCKRSFNPV